MTNKPNVVFTRVDNRLIHGQVAMVWANKSGANLILVVDDEVATDEFQKSIMTMSVSSTGIGVRFWSVEKTIKDIWKAAPTQKIFIVTKTPHEVRKLVEAGIPIHHVNLGNMHSGPGKKQFAGEYVYADEQDIADIEAIKSKGITVSAQVLPEYKEIHL